MENPAPSRLTSLSKTLSGGMHPAILHALLLLIPVNIYVIARWVGAGVQFPLFRYQDTSWGTSTMTILTDAGYVISGTLVGRTANSLILWILGTSLLVMAFLAALTRDGGSRARLRGLAVVAASLLFLLSLMVQYGPLLHGPPGIAIPVGVPVLLVTGLIILRSPSEVPDPGKELPAWVSPLLEVLLIFLVSLLVYNTATGIRMSGDTTPAQILPLSILKYGEISADHFLSYFNTPDNLYAFVSIRGHYYSYFPVVTPVLVVPVYILPYLLISLLQLPLDNSFLPILARFAAAVVAAGSVVMVFLCARALFSSKTAWLTTITYAFATSTWAISSQALWQQGMVELILALLIFTILRNEAGEAGEAGWHLVALGALSGLLAMARPPDALLLIPIIFYILRHQLKRAHLYFIPGILAALPFLFYNLSIFGSPFGGYERNLGLFGLTPGIIIHFAGFLASPNMGFFIFSPVLLFGIWGYFRTRDLVNPRIRELLVLFGPVILLLVLVYSFYTEWTGVAYGPRFLTGLLPVYVLYVGLFLDHAFRTFTGRRRTGILAVFAVLLLLSMGIQVIGVFCYPFLRDVGMDDRRVWDPGDSLVLRSYRDGAEQMTTIQVNSIPPLPPLITMNMKKGDQQVPMNGPPLSREEIMKLSNQTLAAWGGG